MSLQTLIKKIEADKGLGVFSKSEKTTDGGHTYYISFALKPSQQLIVGLGGLRETAHLPLTPRGNIKTTGNKDVQIKSFVPQINSTATLTGKCIDRLFQSGKIYVNNSIFPKGLFSEFMSNPSLTRPPHEGVSWKTRASGLCHAQEIHLLVDTVISDNNRAHTTALPNQTSIDENTPALLLLSNPLVDLSEHPDKTAEERSYRETLLRAMYRNLFDAALREKRQYIAMSTSGFSKHKSQAELYFAVLMTVAQEYPQLNIIFNAGDFESQFDKALEAAKTPTNIVRTTKDVVFLAARLTAQNKPFALHNPSSIGALYGLDDIGAHWQKASTALCGSDPGKTLEANLGIVSTARLGSYGINQKAFKNIVERDLSQVIDVTADIGATEKPAPAIPPISSAHGSGIFPATKPAAPPEALPAPQTKSSLTQKQIEEINAMANRLERELHSCWPYPNKDVKEIKMKALQALVLHCNTMTVSEAIKMTKQEHPRATEGMISTRTADLFRKLENEGSHVSRGCFQF